MLILTVGQGQEFSTLSAAVAASQNGDTIQVQAGTYTDDFSTITTNITIEGVGGMATLVQSATGVIPNGKAILTTDANVTLDHIAFDNAQVPSGNGAGIRYETGALTVTDCYFNGNQDGLLGAANPTGSITVKNSEFTDNGVGDGYTHNIYIGDIASAVLENNFFHDANVGHEIKSRAETNVITGNRIVSGPASSNSYSIDLPDGGASTIANNVIEKGADSSNEVFIHYGGEGGPYANSSLSISNNTVLNDLNSYAVLLYNQTNINAAISNNAVWSLTPSEYVQGGPATVTNTTTLAAEPTLDLSHPWQSGPLASGPDDLVLKLSEDAYQGDAAFIVNVDNVQLGLAQTVTASHAAGQTETFDFAGNFGPGNHVVSVKFLNDSYGGSPSLDRNLYVDGLTYDGTAYPGATWEQATNGSTSVTVPEPSTATHTLVLNLSEDAYLGNAQFTVSIDGVSQGPAQSVTALHSLGQGQAFTYTGDYAPGLHDVQVSFVNDAYGGPGEDRNLYVNSISYDGASVPNSTAPLFSNGADNFQFGTPPAGDDTLVLNLSEDSFRGDAQFIAYVDGRALGPARSVTALHGSGGNQAFSFSGGFGAGPHTVEVDFINDAYGGSPSLDRNLYVDSLNYDGQAYTGDKAAIDRNGGYQFTVNIPDHTSNTGVPVPLRG